MLETRSGKRREILMKAAARLFLKHGYDGVALDDIVERAGGSKSTVYNLFGSKCGLFIASIDSLCREFNEPLRDLDYTGLDLRRSLEKLGVALVTLIVQQEYLALHRLVIAESGHCPELGQAWYELGPKETLGLIARVLHSHTDRSRDGAGRVHSAAGFLHDALVTDLQHRLLSGVGARTDPRALNARVRETVRLFLTGFEARNGSIERASLDR